MELVYQYFPCLKSQHQFQNHQLLFRHPVQHESKCLNCCCQFLLQGKALLLHKLSICADIEIGTTRFRNMECWQLFSETLVHYLLKYDSREILDKLLNTAGILMKECKEFIGILLGKIILSFEQNLGQKNAEQKLIWLLYSLSEISECFVQQLKLSQQEFIQTLTSTILHCKSSKVENIGLLLRVGDICGGTKSEYLQTIYANLKSSTDEKFILFGFRLLFEQKDSCKNLKEVAECITPHLLSQSERVQLLSLQIIQTFASPYFVGILCDLSVPDILLESLLNSKSSNSCEIVACLAFISQFHTFIDRVHCLGISIYLDKLIQSIESFFHDNFYKSEDRIRLENFTARLFSNILIQLQNVPLTSQLIDRLRSMLLETRRNTQPYFVAMSMIFQRMASISFTEMKEIINIETLIADLQYPSLYQMLFSLFHSKNILSPAFLTDYQSYMMNRILPMISQLFLSKSNNLALSGFLAHLEQFMRRKGVDHRLVTLEFFKNRGISVIFSQFAINPQNANRMMFLCLENSKMLSFSERNLFIKEDLILNYEQFMIDLKYPSDWNHAKRICILIFLMYYNHDSSQIPPNILLTLLKKHLHNLYCEDDDSFLRKYLSLYLMARSQSNCTSDAGDHQFFDVLQAVKFNIFNFQDDLSLYFGRTILQFILNHHKDRTGFILNQLLKCSLDGKLSFRFFAQNGKTLYPVILHLLKNSEINFDLRSKLFEIILVSIDTFDDDERRFLGDILIENIQQLMTQCSESNHLCLTSIAKGIHLFGLLKDNCKGEICIPDPCFWNLFTKSNDVFIIRSLLDWLILAMEKHPEQQILGERKKILSDLKLCDELYSPLMNIAVLSRVPLLKGPDILVALKSNSENVKIMALRWIFEFGETLIESSDVLNEVKYWIYQLLHEDDDVLGELSLKCLKKFFDWFYSSDWSNFTILIFLSSPNQSMSFDFFDLLYTKKRMVKEVLQSVINRSLQVGNESTKKVRFLMKILQSKYLSFEKREEIKNHIKQYSTSFDNVKADSTISIEVDQTQIKHFTTLLEKPLHRYRIIDSSNDSATFSSHSVSNERSEQQKLGFKHCNASCDITAFDSISIPEKTSNSCIDAYEATPNTQIESDSLNISNDSRKCNANKRWSDDESLKLLIWMDEDSPDLEKISNNLGRSRSSIQRKYSQLQSCVFPHGPSFTWSSSEDNYLLSNFYNLTIEQLQLRLKRSKIEICQRISELNSRKRTRRTKSSSNSQRKLFDGESPEIGC